MKKIIAFMLVTAILLSGCNKNTNKTDVTETTISTSTKPSITSTVPIITTSITSSETTTTTIPTITTSTEKTLVRTNETDLEWAYKLTLRNSGAWYDFDFDGIPELMRDECEAMTFWDTVSIYSLLGDEPEYLFDINVFNGKLSLYRDPATDEYFYIERRNVKAKQLTDIDIYEYHFYNERLVTNLLESYSLYDNFVYSHVQFGRSAEVGEYNKVKTNDVENYISLNYEFVKDIDFSNFYEFFGDIENADEEKAKFLLKSQMANFTNYSLKLNNPAPADVETEMIEFQGKKYLKDIDYIDILASKPIDWNALSQFKNLTSVNVGYWNGEDTGADLSPLYSMKNITELYINYYYDEKLLSKMTWLKRLTVCVIEDKDIQFVKNLTSLEYIYISAYSGNTTYDKDNFYEPLYNLPNLKILHSYANERQKELIKKNMPNCYILYWEGFS